jgi:hypothetical protein
MPASRERLVRVHVDWNGWRSAEVPLSDVEEPHWFRPRDAPQTLLYGYVQCTDLVTGAFPHECDGIAGPHHRLHVCILKKHVIPSAYEELARRADADREVPRRTGARLSPGA